MNSRPTEFLRTTPSIGRNLAGFGDQHQIELLVEGGFTPVGAIQVATQNAARFLREDDRIGTLASGKVADLLAVHGDPSSNISDIEDIELVFKEGIAYDSPKLIQSVGGLVGPR